MIEMKALMSFILFNPGISILVLHYEACRILCHDVLVLHSILYGLPVLSMVELSFVIFVFWRVTSTSVTLIFVTSSTAYFFVPLFTVLLYSTMLHHNLSYRSCNFVSFCTKFRSNMFYLRWLALSVALRYFWPISPDNL